MEILSLSSTVGGAELLHLQCHFGLVTPSWARMGARRGVTSRPWLSPVHDDRGTARAEHARRVSRVEPARPVSEAATEHTGRGGISYTYDVLGLGSEARLRREHDPLPA